MISDVNTLLIAEDNESKSKQRAMRISYQEYKSPLTMQIEMTSACNHKCIHCYNYWREPGEVVGTLNSENMRKIIDNMIESDVLELVITGGEPLLFPDLVLETIDRAQTGGIICHVNTNLALMTDKIAEELKERSVPILTSFPSCNPKTFDGIVQKEGAFERVLKGIKIAQKHGINPTANMVVMQQNYNDILSTGRFLYNEGIRLFTATKVHPSQTCARFGDIQLKPEQVKVVLDSLLQLRKELGITIDTLTCYPMCLFEDMETYGDLVIPRCCSAGKAGGVVGADGGVRPCTHCDESYGNAVTESILDIWPRLKEWRDGSLIPDECHNCKWVAECSGGCRMDAKFVHKCKAKQDPYMVTNKDFNITFPEPAPLPKISVDCSLALHPFLRFRNEEFGTILKAGRGMTIVTKDTEILLQSLKDKVFTLRDVVSSYELDASETESFFAGLMKGEFLVEVSRRDELINNPDN